MNIRRLGAHGVRSTFVSRIWCNRLWFQRRRLEIYSPVVQSDALVLYYATSKSLLATCAPWQVFQAFSCEDFPEVDKSYLRADFSVECNTVKHNAFKIYAAIMVFVCEF